MKQLRRYELFLDCTRKGNGSEKWDKYRKIKMEPITVRKPKIEGK